MTKVFSTKVFCQHFFSKRALRAAGLIAFAAVSVSTSAVFANGAKPVTSPAPTVRHPVTSESAEICHSNDGRFIALRGFGETATTLLMRNPDPKGKPIVKEGFTFAKDPAIAAQKNAVAPELFELIAESFGATSKPKSQWKGTYEGRFDGAVVVSDDTGKKLGSMMMSCHSAIVEY